MTRKIILGLLIVLVTTMTGAACGCDSDNTKETTEKLTLTVWGVLDEPSVYQYINDLYHGINDNITIEYVKKDYAEYEKETLDALAAGKGPDIWMIRNDWVYKHYDKLEPMYEGLFKKSKDDTRTNLEVYTDMFPEIAVKDNIIDDKIYGIPLSIDTLVIYNNKKHYSKIISELTNQKRKEEARLFYYTPNNWDEFITMAKLLTQKDANGNITQAGAALGTANNINNSQDIVAALMLQNNASMTSADKLTATFNLPVAKETGEQVFAGTQALNFYTSFAKKDADNYMWNSAMPNSVEAFIQGKVSMIIDYGALRNRLEQEAPKFEYDIGPFPQINGATTASDYASYWTFTVTNNSKHPKSSWNYLKYLYGKAEVYAKATNRPVAKRINTLDLPNTKLRATLGGIPFNYQQQTAKYWFKGKEPVKIDNIFYEMIQNVNNGINSQTAIDNAAAAVTKTYQIGVTTTPTPTPEATK